VTASADLGGIIRLHSAFKEFFEPLGSNDPRADFFTIYRRKSDEFDKDYSRSMMRTSTHHSSS
jgi:hypothetical protein